MPEWARKLGIDSTEWNRFRTYMFQTFGDRARLILGLPVAQTYFQTFRRSFPAPAAGRPEGWNWFWGAPGTALAPQGTPIMPSPGTLWKAPPTAEAGEPTLPAETDGERRQREEEEAFFRRQTELPFLQFEWQKSQAELARQDALARQAREFDEEAQARWSSQMTQALMATARRRQPEDFRPQMEATFEEWRRRLLGELTGPADWITRWQVAHRPNPFTVNEDAITEQRIGQLEILKAERPGDQAVERELQQLRAEAEAQAEERGEAPPRPPRPMAPPTPAWLPEFVPGLVAGQAIRRLPVPTPSGQQLSRMPWSQAQGLAGFAEWAGGRPWRDILGEAEIMAPRTPVGAGRTAWRPAMQV